MSTLRIRGLALFTLGIAIALVPVTARAQQASAAPAPEVIAQARTLFESGVHFSDQERWGDALDAFRRSRAILERPNTVFNMGSALVRPGRHIEAAQAFEDFLRMADVHDTARRAEAEHLLGESRAAIAHVALTGIPDEADVLVDGVLRDGHGTSRDIAIDPGQHVVEIRATGFSAQRITVEPAAGARIDQRVQLIADPAAATQGRLRVSSSTVGASIFIDGVAVPGHGSVDRMVQLGSHTIRVVAPGYRTFERTLSIAAGETTTVPADLARAEASGGVLHSPVLWLVVGVVVVAAVAVPLAWYELAPQPLYTGSSDTVIQGIERR